MGDGRDDSHSRGLSGLWGAGRAKDRRKAKLRDLEIAGRPAVLVWNKRIWSCAEPACPAKTWTEQNEFALPRKSMTERARADGARCVGEDNDSV